MELKDLSTTELKVYYNFINDKIREVLKYININGGNEQLYDKKDKLYIRKLQIDKEIDRRINDFIDFKDEQD